ncbi:MAG: sigma-70 family RNA polymerase sigma factor [Victivallales bacterium]|nr:sigma-70 family RNA polymerase sigma factor [Victivallales bacterium]
MEIWEAIAADPQAGAKRLIAEYGDRLFAAAMILTQESHSAEDLVSRTFCQVLTKITRFDPAYSFWNWLYTILLNYYRTDLRKHRAEVAETSDFVEDRVGEEVDGLSRLTEIDAEILRRAVARLSPEMRTVIMLRYFEDRTLSEMVQILGIPSGTVKVRLHRARARLNETLSKLFHEGGKEG